MSHLRVWVPAVLLALASGCATTYQPLKIDPKTDLYPSSVQVDPGGVQVYVTTTDPKSFPVVLLLTETNYRPTAFSFMLRDSLAQDGITAVYTAGEFMAMAQDQKFATGEHVAADVIKRYSASVAPVLVINASYTNVWEANWVTNLVVQDGRTGQTLLKINHPRLVWVSFDSEALYPVLNKLRLWIKESAKGTT